MNQHEIFELVRENVVDIIGLSENEVQLDSHFFKDLGCDSLLLAELVMTFEDKFGIIIPDSDAENLSTVQSVVEYILDHQSSVE